MPRFQKNCSSYRYAASSYAERLVAKGLKAFRNSLDLGRSLRRLSILYIEDENRAKFI